MKKLASLAVVIFLFAGVNPVFAQRFVVGEIFSRKGEPEFEHENFGRRKVITGSAVYANDFIKTDAKSSVVVAFFDQNFLKIGPNTQMRLTKYIYNSERAFVGGQLDLLLGQIRLWTERKLKDELMQIRTANAVAGVRGTEFEFAYDQSQNSSLIVVLEGKVFFNNRILPRDEGKVIPKGYWGEIKGQKAPGEPQPISKKPANFQLIER